MGDEGFCETRYITDYGTVHVHRTHGDYASPDAEEPEVWLGLSIKRNEEDAPDRIVRLTNRVRWSLIEELAEDAPEALGDALREWVSVVRVADWAAEQQR